jgi:trimethylamine---corrinoid protein Co-methyltransferase
MFVNRMPRYDVLSEEAMATLEDGWRRLVSEIGIRFDCERAQARFRAAGQDVGEEGVVRFDPDFLLEQVAKAPEAFPVRSRNPDRDIVFGGDHMVFGGVAGAPFVLDGDERHDGTLADLERFVQLGHTFDEIDTTGLIPCEPTDRPLDSRHLEMMYAQLTLTDKVPMAALFDGAKTADSLAMTAIVLGGDDELERAPAVYGVSNVNSPLRYDVAMLEVMESLALRNQVTVVTPFLLMGAMAPVAIPSALVQQTAEQLAGVAYAQLVRPGAPVLLGSFLSHTDMQSGSPGFGGPESAIGLLASGQLARRFGLPWRSGGGALTSSQRPDAQAAFEGLNTMLPAFLAGANFLLHSAGWLESGLVASYAKYVLDIEAVRILREEFTPLEVTPESLAFDAHSEVGHAGHFLGAAHTLERFRTCFYRPITFSTANYQRWLRDGGHDAADRAAELARATLERYERPPLDDARLAELDEFVERRRAELGD